MKKYCVVLQGERIDPDRDVTDVIAPTMMRVDCWRMALSMLGPLGQPPRVRFWVAPVLDNVRTMSMSEREAFALGWIGRETIGDVIPQPQARALVKPVVT